jgi:AcrR family transcriptional regulator
MARKRTRDAAASKGAILEAAQEVFVRRGYHGAGVEEIARRAGVAKGTVFLHFKNKENLLFTLVQHRLEKIGDLYVRTARPGMSAHDLLVEMTAVERWLKGGITDITRTVLSMWSGLPSGLRSRMQTLLRDHYKLYRRRIAALLAEHLGADHVDGVSVDDLATALMAATDGLVIRTRVFPGLQPSAARVGRALRLLFVEALARRGKLEAKKPR